MVDVDPAASRSKAISIVGRSDSGKTTLIEALVPRLKHHGLVVGIIKHHHRTELFDVPGKDTYRFASSGADVIVGVSPLQTAVFTPRSGDYDLESAIETHLGSADVVLIEGYKRGDYPKIEVHRSERSPDLLCEPDDIWALVSDRTWDIDARQFGHGDIEALATVIVEWVR